ncbi:MAG: TIGR00341 family protein, partial [Bacteroides sp.]|nr:TIGR00341 family protein [Bacteroides sp.]
DSLQKALADFTGASWVDRQVGAEIKVLFPFVNTISIARNLQLNIDSSQIDTVMFAFVDCTSLPSAPEKQKMYDWLKARTGSSRLKLVMDK